MTAQVPLSLLDAIIKIYEEVTDDEGDITLTLLFEYLYIQNLRLIPRLIVDEYPNMGTKTSSAEVIGRTYSLSIGTMYFSKDQAYTQAFDDDKKYRIKIEFDELTTGQYEVYWCKTCTPRDWELAGTDPNIMVTRVEYAVEEVE